MVANTDTPALETVRETLTTLANELLDAFYQENPHANAYGAGYDAPGEDRETWYLGRENGANGAEAETGVDFWYRKFLDLENEGGRRRASEEYEYVYGDYGWMDTNQLLDERNRLRQLFEAAVEDGFLDQSSLERFAAAFDQAEAELQEWRETFSLVDVEMLFREHDADTLFDLLAHGDEESRVVWSLLYSKDEDGEQVENPLEVPVASEEDAMMFVRAERTYIEDDGTQKEYAYGAVIGYDDTPERFFVHRLESDPDLRDPETEWTVELLKEKMGFDAHLWEVNTRELPVQKIVRVQGDLAVVRHDYHDALWEYRGTLLEQKRQSIAREYASEFFEAHPEYENHDAISTRSFGPRFRVNKRVAAKTPELKALQDDLNITEESVRERMRPDWKQLTAKRRRQLMDELLMDRLETWAVEQSERTASEIADNAEAEAREAFTETERQINAVHGNHTLILGPATEHPDRTWGDDGTLAVYVVPAETEANGFVLHDEHQDKELTLGPGLYEVRFLDGYEDQWWM